MSEKILVIGDSCNDIFQYGKCDRLSPEAPVPIITPTRVIENEGMAMNVYNNLKGLNVNVDIYTNDINELMPKKIRFVDEQSNQILLRLDIDDKVNPIDWNVLKNIQYNNYDGIVISDYNKGFLNEEQIEYISNNHQLTFLDTKKKIGDWAKKIKFIKINKKEFNDNIDVSFINSYDGTIIVTLGGDGAMIINIKESFNNKIISIENKLEVRDLSGAGDSFFAAFVADYIKNYNICGAVKFANLCASWVVSKKGVTVIDINKIKYL